MKKRTLKAAALTKFKRLIIFMTICAATVMTIFGLFLYQPYATLNALREAAAAKDAEAISERVDFLALRESFKAKMMASLSQQLDQTNAQGERLGLLFGSALIGPMIDAFVSPAGIQALFSGQAVSKGAENADSGASGASGAKAADDIKVKTVWKSSTIFHATVQHKSGSNPVTMVLRRHGMFDWKLSGIE